MRAARRRAVASQLKLARVREEQLRELAATGAGSRFDYEQAQTDVANLKAQLDAATASESQVREKLAAKTDSGDQDEIANVKAQIAARRGAARRTRVGGSNRPSIARPRTAPSSRSRCGRVRWPCRCR